MHGDNRNTQVSEQMRLERIKAIVFFVFFSLFSVNSIFSWLLYFMSLRDARYWIFADIRYADIFQIILGRYRYISFVCKQHQVSPVQKL